MKRTKPIIYLAIFVAGFIVSNLWQSFKASSYWRPVQYLQNPARTHKAILERVDRIDLKFRVLLDGKTVYRSPDFRPSPSVALRETLLWDDTGQVLILEVLGRRLFGFDAAQNRQLSDDELLSAKVTKLPIEKHGFEGKWPTKQN